MADSDNTVTTDVEGLTLYPVYDPPEYTTLAIGEEGGDDEPLPWPLPRPIEPKPIDPIDDPVTTLALGEEGGDCWDWGDGHWCATTLALGEEEPYPILLEEASDSQDTATVISSTTDGGDFIA